MIVAPTVARTKADPLPFDQRPVSPRTLVDKESSVTAPARRRRRKFWCVSAPGPGIVHTCKLCSDNPRNEHQRLQLSCSGSTDSLKRQRPAIAAHMPVSVCCLSRCSSRCPCSRISHGCREHSHSGGCCSLLRSSENNNDFPSSCGGESFE